MLTSPRLFPIFRVLRSFRSGRAISIAANIAWSAPFVNRDPLFNPLFTCLASDMMYATVVLWSHIPLCGAMVGDFRDRFGSMV